jgi:hypothetical protein
LRRNDSIWLAALFGFLTGCILWFHFLFATIVLVLALSFFAVKGKHDRTAWRQFGVTFSAIALAVLPTVPGSLYIFRTSGTHVFAAAPNLLDLVWTLTPGWILPMFIVALLLSAFSKQRQDSRNHAQRWQILLCLTLAMIPILILYGVSVGTSIHIFSARYRLVSAPGTALCWGLIFGCFHSRAAKLLFCISLVAVSTMSIVSSPYFRQHQNPLKYALEMVERNASIDNSPVLICSGFIESTHAVMPIESAKTSYLFAPLSYYHRSVPVVPLPILLNDEAI